jgi:hypothetical protein
MSETSSGKASLSALESGRAAPLFRVLKTFWRHQSPFLKKFVHLSREYSFLK